MPDFGVTSLVGLIDGVKVLAFAVKEGRVAVHCHAGLGRTGVLIACYLIYTLRISASEAVHYVRIKRPRSIQTRAQINQVFDFARLLGTQLIQFPDLSLRHGAPVTLQHYLNRQALLLHGQEARKLRYTPKVVYLVCVRLSCLALGVSSPPEIQMELEKRSAIRTLARAVRETLVSKQYVPLLSEVRKGSWAGSGSVSSWDEPLGYLERRQHVLLDKRSYSESDLCKLRLNEDEELSSYCTEPLGGEKHWCVPGLLQTDLRPLHRNPPDPGPTMMARHVAKALAHQGPAGDSVLQRSALLQEELNSSDCGWALLVTESDPQVLCCLLWTWLEKLRDPVLSVGDVERLKTEGTNKTPLSLLKKPQRHTILCLLSCVSTVISLCPHREEAVLQRLVGALTKCSQEELGSVAALMKVLRASLRETVHRNKNLMRACSTNASL